MPRMTVDQIRGRDGRARSARGRRGGLSVPKPPKGVVVAVAGPVARGVGVAAAKSGRFSFTNPTTCRKVG